jgi:hypothetical protein
MAWCAVIIAVAYILVGITHFLMPREQLHMAGGVKATFFESLKRTSTAFRLHYWFFIIAALSGAALVTGLPATLGLQPSLILTMSQVGTVFGFLITALNFGFIQERALRVSRIWSGLSATAQESLQAEGLLNLDPTGLFCFGLPGIGLCIINTIAINAHSIPVWLGVVGCLGGISFLTVFGGMVFSVGVLVDIGAGIGGFIAAPIWGVGLAYFLLHLR